MESHDHLGLGPLRISAELRSREGPVRGFAIRGGGMRSEVRVPGATLWPRAERPPRSLVKVLLCEDQEVFRLGLRVVLEMQGDMAVVAETDDAATALGAAARDGAHVLVIRLRLLGTSALPALRDLCRRGVAVLVLAEPGDEPQQELVDVLRAGVRGYLPRRSAAQRIVDGVRALARHEAALDVDATSRLVQYLSGAASFTEQGPGALAPLTERQRDVAELVGQGLSNEEIAARLFLSVATVKSHLTTSMRRLGVRTRTQLAILINRESYFAA
jgi:DNA-binding NarL/FixJ family response regulator